MDVETLRRAIDIIKDGPVELYAQSLTYLRTYLHIIDAVWTLPHQQEIFLLQFSVIAYEWITCVAWLDSLYFEDGKWSTKSCNRTGTKIPNEAAISTLSNCQDFGVGTSIILHLLSQSAYPVWGSKVAKVWRRNLTQNNIIKPKLYIAYAIPIHEMLACRETQEFVADFNQAYSERLNTLDKAPNLLS